MLPGNEFANYTLESIRNQGFGLLGDLSPDNTLVLGSTFSIGRQFKNLGYKLLPAELNPAQKPIPLPVICPCPAGPVLSPCGILNFSLSFFGLI